MLAKALRLLRTINDLSQHDLAKDLQVSPAYLSQIESGKRKASTDVIARYAQVFKVPVSTLWLFSETLKENTLKERSRVFAADKLLRIMEAVAGAEQIHEDSNRTHDEVVSH
jgi:transcriptional regulator with XRE-family HTH domain